MSWHRWRRELFAPAKPRLYLSGKHTDVRMHLGGIGTGNFEVGVDGQFTTWQLFNTLRDGQVPLHFLVRAGGATRLLQTAGGPDWPRVQQIEMTGEYPVAELRFRDASLPVEVELTAFSPFAPLDAGFSSMPLAVFVFRMKNPTKQKQTVSLAAVMQNPVGYDAAGPNIGAANPCFGGNVNEVLREGGAGGLFMRAEAAGEPTLDKAVAIYAGANLKALQEPPPDRPKNLRLEVLEKEPLQSGQAERSGAYGDLAGGGGGGPGGTAGAGRTGGGAGGRNAALVGQDDAAVGSLWSVDGRQAGRRGPPAARYCVRGFRARVRELAGERGGVRQGAGARARWRTRIR